MKKYLLAFALVVGITSYTNAQANLTEEEVTELTELKDQISGTYQIQMIDTRSNPTMPLVAFREIDQRRKQSEIVYYQLNVRTRIKILSKDEIDAPGFIAPEPVKYVSSSNL